MCDSNNINIITKNNNDNNTKNSRIYFETNFNPPPGYKFLNSKTPNMSLFKKKEKHNKGNTGTFVDEPFT